MSWALLGQWVLLSSAFVSLSLHLGFGLIFRHFEFGLIFKLELSFEL